MTIYGPDRLGIESRWGRSFLCPSRLAPMAHQACCTVSTGSFPVLNWPGCGANHLCLSNARVAEWCGAVTLPPICACVGMLRGDLYLYLYLSSASCHITFLHSCLENCITFVSYPAYTEDLCFCHISSYQGAAFIQKVKPILCVAFRSTWWCRWLRHCATTREVAGSIPDGVIGIFHCHNPSGRTMALGLTLPLTEMSTRNISWG